MVSKILTLLLKVLMNGAIATPQAPDQGFLANLNLASLRRVLLIVTGIAASLMLTLGGIFTILLDLVLTSRDAHAIYLSQTSLVGVGLIVLSLLFVAILSRRNIWLLPTEHARQQQPQEPMITPILDAVASLIGDFAMERKMEREMKAQAYAETRAYADAQARAHAMAQAHQEQSARGPSSAAQPTSTASMMDPATGTVIKTDPFSGSGRPAFN